MTENFEFPANTPEWIKRIDFTELKTQKNLLLEIINNNAVDPKHKEGLEGILALIDTLQDYAVDELGIPETLVYDFVQEGLEAILAINNTLSDKTKSSWICPDCGSNNKTVWICPYCGSDNIKFKVWAKANTNEIIDSSPLEGEDCYCLDCEENGELILSTVNVDAKVEGFQVVDIEGNIHPDMDGSFCLYNLSQAREMLEDNDNGNEQWKLLAIWTGDIEEPTIMFEGDPRD
jgi:predicted RNA-binding Zn-ribbon protein involved in translation (DUF1610 family)